MTDRTTAQRYLSDAQIASYHENGYLVLPNVLTARRSLPGCGQPPTRWTRNGCGAAARSAPWPSTT